MNNTIESVLRENLTNEQYDTVIDGSKNILCLACAGSGKSRTLAYKIAYILSQGALPESIVAFTFTEKAAESIKRRVAEALRKFGLPENYIGAMFIGTIDSFCQKLLGNIDAKYRQYEIMDQNGLFLFALSRKWNIGIPTGQGLFNRVKSLVEDWQVLNNENLNIDDVIKQNNDLGMLLINLKKSLLESGYLDFSFAIRLATEELERISDYTGSEIEKYRYLLVDEYQDINPIQEAFIQRLSSFTEMLFVVGDDDQAIYGWRGANVQNILTFTDRYKDVSVHKLLINFRSTRAIVETANQFVQSLIPYERLTKTVHSNSDGNIQDLRKLWFENCEEEAKWIAKRIKALIGTTYVEYNSDGSVKRSRGLAYSDFAILLRGIHSSNGENRDVRFVKALEEENIPYKTTGEGGIFDRPYARILLDTMELLGEKNNNIDTAARLFDDSIIKHFRYASKAKFLQVLQKWHNLIQQVPTINQPRRKVYPQQLLHDLLDAFMIRDLTDETALRDLGLFSKIILDIEKTYISIDTLNRYQEMLLYIRFKATNAYELEPLDYIAKDDAVNISTIHKVKGLEFPVVFLVDLVSARFPGKSSNYQGDLPHSLMEEAIRRGAYGNRLQDEARLFYTAVTRAERILYLTGSAIHPGLATRKKPSRFMESVNHPCMRVDTENDQLASKIEPAPRFDDSDFPTDYSSVKLYLSCPFAYKLSSVYGYHAAVPELFGFGKTSHTTLEKLHQLFRQHAPSKAEVEAIVESTFMLQHVFPSKDPENRPGSFERAKALLKRILVEYSEKYADDFGRVRQDEARFEIAIKDALITGAIDLLLKEDQKHHLTTADVIDFKTMELPDNSSNYDWRDMSIQVQLYSKAAREVMGENVQTGFIHTLKDNKRTAIPVDATAVDNAIKTIEWAVTGILDGDFPMRPCQSNCNKCDFSAFCAKRKQEFKRSEIPPTIHTPSGEKTIAAFDLEDQDNED